MFTAANASRAEALSRLAAFAPRMGREYAARRNHDRGAGGHHDVSRLSPWIRRRLVTEREVVAAAIAEHGTDAAEKFVQEVFWRGYFKGWLEQRPQVWTAYADGLLADLAALERDPALRRQVEGAERGATGLTCFDAWAKELTRTGYLHNHARMWFASIWIFTLQLPWRLGADFFYRHLLDGDPASNTLSWRWVAGLHTRGKAYAAQAANIAEFTGGRFAPRQDELAAEATALTGEEPDGLPAPLPLRSCIPPKPGVPAALLLTEEDCTVEHFALDKLDIRAAASLAVSHLRSPRAAAEPVAAFEAAALRDAAARSGFPAETLRAEDPAALAAWADGAGARQIVMPYTPTGPLYDWLTQARSELAERGIALCEWQRDWDALVWPHAIAGFSKVKKQIPLILNQAGLA